MTKKIVFTLIILLFSFYNGLCFANGEKMEIDKTFLRVVEKTLGKDVKVLRIEDPEDSPIKGLKQIRVWIESVYGETPVLFYMTDDEKMFIAGSIFDFEGNNLTRRDVGETIPRNIEASKVNLRHEYSLGSDKAPVQIVMWLGTDVISLKIFDTLYRIYMDNNDKVALYWKFYPTNKDFFQQDFNRSVALSCFKGKDFLNGINFIKGASPAWASDRKDIDAFIKEKGFKDCDEKIVKQDLDLAKSLKLPLHQVIFVNGTILINDVTKENVSKLAGVELR